MVLPGNFIEKSTYRNTFARSVRCMNHFRRKKSTFIIILSTYILTFIIPLVALFQFMFPKLENEMMIQLEQSLQAEVLLCATQFNDAVITLNNYAISLTQNATLSTNILNEDTPLNRIIISEEFSKVVSNDPWMASAFLYSKQFHRYYSRNNSCPAEWMNQSSSSFYYEHFTSEELKEFCDSVASISILEQKTVFFQGEYLDCLTVALPVKKTDLVLFALIPVEDICSLSQENGGTLLIVDDKDRIIAGNLMLSQTQAEDIRQFNFIKNHTSQQRSINGTRYLLHQSDINCNHLRAVSIHEYDSAMKPFHALYTQTAYRCIVIFIIGITLIAGGLLFTYIPLRRLKKELLDSNADLPLLSSSQYLNDWNVISMSIRHLNDRNTIITEQLRELQGRAQELFLCRYLYGDIRDERHIIEMANIYTIHIHDYVTCVAFSFLSGKDFDTSFMYELKERFYRLNFHNAPSSTVSCYFVETIRSAEVILILFYDSEQELRPFLKILETQDPAICIGIGSREQLDNPARSNALALAALENAKLENTGNTVNYMDIPVADTKHLSRALEQISLYDSAVSQKSLSQAQAMFEPVLKTLFYTSRSNHSTQTLYMNLHNTIVHHLNQAGQNYSPAYVPQDIPKDHTTMIATLEQLHEELLNELKRYPETEHESTTISQVLQYIESNYQDVNISLLSISEKFGFSYSNFSHFFRKQTGSTFSNYLERLRINKAKALLQKTDDILNNIALQVGFNNIGTFTRAFKKQELMTPGSYRENFRKLHTTSSASSGVPPA